MPQKSVFGKTCENFHLVYYECTFLWFAINSCRSMKCGLFDNIISDCLLKVLVELGAFNQVICQQMVLIYPDTSPPSTCILHSVKQASEVLQKTTFRKGKVRLSLNQSL